jgi:hypothetical protein
MSSPEQRIDQIFPLSEGRIGRLRASCGSNDHYHPKLRGKWSGGFRLYDIHGSIAVGDLEDLRIVHTELTQFLARVDETATADGQPAAEGEVADA